MTDAIAERRFTPKGAATRERIVKAAAELIARNGVAGTSTEDVRRSAGVSGSQLYHYFDGKQALIRAVITRQADAMAEPDGSPPLGALDSFEAIRAWAEAAIERQQQTIGAPDCELSTLAGELGSTDDGARREIASGFLRWQRTLVGGLAAMRDRGELAQSADLDELAFVLLAALQGGQLLTRTLLDTAGLRAAMRAAVAYVESFATER